MSRIALSLVPLFTLGWAALVAAGGTVAAQAPAITGPFALPGDAVIAAAPANQSVPRLSAGGGQILAVWQDNRTSPLYSNEQSGLDIWATRLDANGAPIDAVAFPVAMGGGDQKTPRVAWNGTHWLVAWVGQISTTGYYTNGVFAARVAPDGTVLDDPPILVRGDLASGSFGDVASDGDGWAVFFTGWDGATSNVYGARIAANGALLDPTPKIVATPGSSPNTPFGVSADWAGGRYLVAWSQWASGLDDVRGRLTNAALTPQGVTFNVATSADYEVHPDVASNGSQFFVIWDRYNNCCVGGASKAYGTRVTIAGAVLDGPVGVAIYDTNGYGFQGCDPAVAWDGLQWVASWTEPDTGGLRINAGRISAAGVVLDFNGFQVDPLPVRQEASAVVGRPGGGSLVAWQDSRVLVGQPNDVHGTWIGQDGSSTPIGALALSRPAQVRADANRGPDGETLLVWTSMTSGVTRVLGQRLDAQGGSLALPVEVATGTTLGDAHAAWNGAVWLVVWDGPGGIFARRLDATLTPLGAAFSVMSGSDPDVAAQGDTFLVTALIPEAYPQFVDVFARRVSGASGALLDPAPVMVGPTYATAQAVETFGDGFLVAWERHPTHDDPWCTIGLRLVSAANVPGAQSSLSSTSSYNARPALAVSGGNALVVWQRNPGYSITEDIVARLVGPGLVLLGANFDVSAAPYSQTSPSAAWDGAQYVVAWTDGRSTSAYLFDRRTDVYAARVSAAGALLDPSGIALVTGGSPETWTAVAPFGAGAALVAWSDFQEGDGFAGYRLAWSLLGDLPAWMDLGHALAGSAGPPQLVGTGTLVAGTPVGVSLADALPAAPTLLIVGLSRIDAPFKGGVLVPQPDLIVGVQWTDGAGGWQLSGTWPAGAPSGFSTWMQAWLADPAGPAGFAASNALRATTP